MGTGSLDRLHVELAVIFVQEKKAHLRQKGVAYNVNLFKKARGFK